MTQFKHITALAIFLTSISGFAASDIAAGQEKAQTCVACHGVNGNSVVPTFPKLAGQHASYTLKQLKQYKSKERDNAIMYGQALALTDQDMENLAAYYAAQTATPGMAMGASAEKLALGKKLYNGGKLSDGTTACIACHGVNGKGIPSAKFPSIAGQHSMYTSSQLKLFRQNAINNQIGTADPVRNNDYEGMMRNVVSKLSNDEIDALSSYIATLK